MKNKRRKGNKQGRNIYKKEERKKKKMDMIIKNWRRAMMQYKETRRENRKNIQG